MTYRLALRTFRTEPVKKTPRSIKYLVSGILYHVCIRYVASGILSKSKSTIQLLRLTWAQLGSVQNLLPAPRSIIISFSFHHFSHPMKILPLFDFPCQKYFSHQMKILPLSDFPCPKCFSHQMKILSNMFFSSDAAASAAGSCLQRPLPVQHGH